MSIKISSTVGQINSKDNSSLELDESQIIDILEDTEKLNELDETENKLTTFSQKLSAKKRKFNFSLKEVIKKIVAQESEVVAQLENICEKYKKISSKKEQCDKMISELKLKLIDFDKEKAELLKSNQKCETTFAKLLIQSDQDKTRDSIFETLSALDVISAQIKSSRSRIFGYQKVLTKYAKDMAPFRTQIHLLNSRIEFEKDSEILHPELPIIQEQTVKIAIATQQLTIEKMRLLNQIEMLKQQIDQLKNDKGEIKLKLSLAQSNDKETILHSVCEQISQYQEALQRRQNSQNHSIESIHNSISKELEIKIEIEAVKNEFKTIQEQKEEFVSQLKQRQSEIAILENQELSTSQEIEIASRDPLTELIIQIQKNRDEELKLQHYQIRDYEIDENELQNVTNHYNNDCKELQSSLARFLKYNKACTIEISKIEKGIELKKNQPTQVFIRQTPKIIVLTKRIAELEDNLKLGQQKVSKKKLKLSKKQALYQEQYDKLDLPHDGPIFISDLYERIQRSMNWFIPLITAQKQSFISANCDCQSLMAQWNTKILSGVINEAEDFELRSRILSNKY